MNFEHQIPACGPCSPLSVPGHWPTTAEVLMSITEFVGDRKIVRVVIPDWEMIFREGLVLDLRCQIPEVQAALTRSFQQAWIKRQRDNS